MGLDMYLRAEKYVSGWKHNDDGELNEWERLVSMFGMEDFVTEGSPSGNVQFTIGYWRKANHIHSWFVRECQDGRDECQPTDVSIEKLRELRDVCLQIMASTKLVPGEYKVGTTYMAGTTTVDYEQGKVMEDTTLAEELLAPESGFFFGSTDYTQYYWQDLEDTLTFIDKCIALDKAPGYWNFIYQSSW